MRVENAPVRTRSLRALVVLLVALAPAAAGSRPAAPGAPPASPVIRLGVVAEELNEPDRMLRLFGAFLARTRERLAPAGIDVGPLVVARDVDDLAQRLTRGEVEFVIETVFPTLILQERSRRLSPSLVVVRRGQREYRSVFFTRNDSSIHSLADLRGRTLVLQVVRSTSAFALPKAELMRAGLSLGAADDPGAARSDVRYRLALAEINQAVWVLHGRGDAGAFNDADWTDLPEKIRAQLRIFHETRPIVRGLLSFRSDIDPRVREAAEQVLVGLAGDDAGRAALAAVTNITRFEPLTSADRRELKGLATVLRPAGR